MENQFGNQPSTKEIEEMMTENQKERSEEREATIEAAGGKIENKDLKHKIEQLNKVIYKQSLELYGREGYEIAVTSKHDKVRVGIGIRIDERNTFRLENPRTHEMDSIPVESIQRVEKIKGVRYL